MHMARSLAALAMVFCAAPLVHGIDNGQAALPPMGYNTWNDFGCNNITAANIVLVADRMVSSGMRDAGYEYLNIDDCWAVGRDPATKRLIADPAAFPEGIKAVADYVHSMDMKLGIYTDRGKLTCQKRPGSKGLEAVDAQTFADWGIDFVKEDSCFDRSLEKGAIKEYSTMRDALNATGRPILFSLCGWRKWYGPVGGSLGNMWRISLDVIDWFGVYRSAVTSISLGKYAGPGGWNDPDMLIGSTGGTFFKLTPAQSRAQFSLWCALAAPLLIGSNMLGMDEWDMQTYTNAEAIAVNQDRLGRQGALVWSNCPDVIVPLDNKVPKCGHIWGRQLSGGRISIVLLNYGPKPLDMVCGPVCLSKACGGGAGCEGAEYNVRDVWGMEDLGRAGIVKAAVEAGGAAMYVLDPAAGTGLLDGFVSVA